MKIYVQHVRACGMCLIPGAKQWFESHGFDWRDFLKNGIDVSLVENIDDSLAKRVIEQAKRGQNGR